MIQQDGNLLTETDAPAATTTKQKVLSAVVLAVGVAIGVTVFRLVRGKK